VLTVVLAVAVVAVVYLRYRDVPQRVLLTVDALGLSIVTVIGAQAAIAAGVNALAVMILATLTGVTGEVVRDLLAGELPPLLLREEIYATCAVAGSVLYLLLDIARVPETVNTMLSAALVFALRIAALVFKLRLPTPTPRHTP
jgi:uncharacterized membrane protein YeiH